MVCAWREELILCEQQSFGLVHKSTREDDRQRDLILPPPGRTPPPLSTPTSALIAEESHRRGNVPQASAQELVAWWQPCTLPSFTAPVEAAICFLESVSHYPSTTKYVLSNDAGGLSRSPPSTGLVGPKSPWERRMLPGEPLGADAHPFMSPLTWQRLPSSREDLVMLWRKQRQLSIVTEIPVESPLNSPTLQR